MIDRCVLFSERNQTMKARIFFPTVFLIAGLTLFYASNFENEVREISNKEVAPDDYPAWMDEVIVPPADVDPKKVYTFVCELPTRKATMFTTACADFGVAVFDIKWNVWSVDGATGTGVFSVNDCEPDCASGTRHEVPVHVWLTDVTSDGKYYFLNTLKIVPSDVYEGRVDEVVSSYLSFPYEVEVGDKTYMGLVWDVTRDWKTSPHMRSDLPD